MATNEGVALGGPSSSRSDRRASPTAPSKRDRKRQLILDKLAALDEKLGRDRDLSYRDQLQKVQVDTNLVQRIDPYAPETLENLAEMRREHSNAQGQAGSADGSRTLLEMSGPRFLDYLQTVEDLVEYRDYQLVQHRNEHGRKRYQYQNEYIYKIETAKREHRALSNTLRDRLINTVTSKKFRLNKEKEALEISDSSALLLHPNQFSITNPASPGGTHSKRATRLRKDAEDLPGFSENKKRKRNPGEDDGSPAPVRRALDPNNTTPLWQNEKLRVAAKQNGPIYTIDKLFTEKELTMAYNAAALAAHKSIMRHRLYANGGIPSPDGSDSGNGDGQDNGDHDTDSWPSAAPMMERQTSHATRSTRAGANHVLDEKALTVDASNNFDLPANFDILQAQEPTKLPPAVPLQYSKPMGRASEANYPPPLSQDEINVDLQLMHLYKTYDAHHAPGSVLDHPNGPRKFLDAASTPYSQVRTSALRSTRRPDPERLREDLGIPVSSVRDQEPTSHHHPLATAAASGGVPMSRQSSLGGAAMSRQGSARGKGRK